jgi:hypothetical protein
MTTPSTETALLDATSPGTALLDATSPGTALLDATSPGTALLDATSPDTTSPDTAPLDAASPGTVRLDAAPPGTAPLQTAPLQTAPLHSTSRDTAPLAHADTLALDYLAALWAASDDLPPEFRDDLMRTVSNYIALRRDLADDPAAVLGRLGPPEQLAAAVRRGGMPTHLRLPASSPHSTSPARASSPSSGGGPEHTAVALLMAGTFVMPLISPTAGLLIATGSPRWSPAQKVAAWMLTLGSAAGAMIVALMLAGLGGGGGLFFMMLYLGCCAGAVAAGLTLKLGMRE